MNRFIPLAAIFLLIGCVSTPKPIALDSPPPSAASEHNDGLAEIVVVRKGIMGFAVSFWIDVDGRRIGAVRTNDLVATRVSPGTVEIVANAEADCTATFPVEANRTYFLKAIPKSGWWYARVQLELLDPEEGLEMRPDLDDMTVEGEEVAPDAMKEVGLP